MLLDGRIFSIFVVVSVPQNRYGIGCSSQESWGNHAGDSSGVFNLNVFTQVGCAT